ncbi:MAG TPA: nucleotidyltransferase domain-containing protein, partial [Albitalea sp.]
MSAALHPAGPPGSVAEVRTRVRAGRDELIAQFRHGRPSITAATRLVRALARHVDQALTELWARADLPPGAALVAVGGYGRGELFPYSDVDVLVLLPAGDPLGTERWRAGIENFIASCWDIGLEIGSSVRTVDECVAEASRDVTVQTALLESRRVCGARRVFEEFRAARDAAM